MSLYYKLDLVPRRPAPLCRFHVSPGVFLMPEYSQPHTLYPPGDLKRRSWRKRGKDDPLRSRKVQIRLTEEEYALHAASAEHTRISLSEHLRRLLMVSQGQGKRRTGKDAYYDRQQLDSLIYELNRIGNNLNQLTKYAHLDAVARLEKGQLLDTLKKLDACLDKVCRL